MSCCEPNGGAGLICIPSAISASERPAHFALAKRLFHELAQQTEETAHGYALRFSPEDLPAVAQFVANERKCCPFMSFEIRVSAAGGPVWLRMTGPEGTPAVLRAELGLPGTCGGR